MKTVEQLRSEFGSTRDEKKIIQKWQIANLDNEEFNLLLAIPDITIYTTPQAQRYIQARKEGKTKKITREDGPEGENDTIEQQMDKAWLSLEKSIRNPR